MFILLHIFISMVLAKARQEVVFFGFQVFLLGSLAGGGFWGDILITDALFSTNIYWFMLMMTGGSKLYLLMLFLGEGLLVCLLLASGVWY